MHKSEKENSREDKGGAPLIFDVNISPSHMFITRHYPEIWPKMKIFKINVQIFFWLIHCTRVLICLAINQIYLEDG